MSSQPHPQDPWLLLEHPITITARSLGLGKRIWEGAVGRCSARSSQNVTDWLGGQHQGVGGGSHRRAKKGDGEGPSSAVPSLLPQLLAQRLLAGAYLHGIYISFASRSIKNLTSSRLPGAACPAW